MSGKTVRKIKSLMKKLQAEGRDKAIAKKEIYAERYGQHIFVHPFSGHVYSSAGRYPVRIGGASARCSLADLIPGIFEIMDNPTLPPVVTFPLSNGATGIGYMTRDVWGQRVYGMPIRAYKESEQEEFMRRLERQEAPYGRFQTTGKEEYFPGHPHGQYIYETEPGLIEDATRGFNVWRLENLMETKSYTPYYGVPYFDKFGQIKLALGRKQWEAEQQFLGLLQSGVVAKPAFYDIDPLDYGFDIATLMG